MTYPIVESGRGRLRFICSAAHTREDVDKTLEALIDAERDVEAQRQVAGQDAGDVCPERSAVVAWVNAFAAYLKETVARASTPAPDLAVSIGLPDHEEAVTLVFNRREVAVGTHDVTDMPLCSLLFTDNRATYALCACDVQGLLDSMIKGTCVVNGQVEPFIWFIGRMVDWQREV